MSKERCGTLSLNLCVSSLRNPCVPSLSLSLCVLFRCHCLRFVCLSTKTCQCHHLRFVCLYFVHLSRKTMSTIAYVLCAYVLCASLRKQHQCHHHQHSFINFLCMSMHCLLLTPICECSGHHCQNPCWCSPSPMFFCCKLMVFQANSLVELPF
jgi:hypothetical protein